MMIQELKSATSIAKTPTGISGLDDVLRGGLPAGRPTLVYGGPGCGKTVLAMHFLVHGAEEMDETGLYISFDQQVEDLIGDFRSLGMQLDVLQEEQRIKLLPANPGVETNHMVGDFSLEGLLVRLRASIERLGARRVVLDSLDALYTGLDHDRRLRPELQRVLHELTELGVTVLTTAELGGDGKTRLGFEEYITDCVILLDHRVDEQRSKRRLRVIKYRGSSHSADEFPFLIGQRGITLIPITGAHLRHEASNEILPTGVKDLDAILGRGGFYRGSSILITGTAGTGKSSLSAAFARAVCEDGNRCLYLAFEESSSQIIRNMRSVGIDLEPYREKGLLTINANRPTSFGLEEHLAGILQQVRDLKPTALIIDPVTNFINVGFIHEVKAMLTRVLDELKAMQVTVLFTSLTSGSDSVEESATAVSSLMDCWIALHHQFYDDKDRVRELYVVKARGMNHSHHRFLIKINDDGLFLDRQDS